MKRIGILGGISHESTIKYYDLILRKYYQRFQNYYYPEIVIYSLDFQKFTDFEDNRNTLEYIEYIMQGIDALESAGVDFVILAANSPHSVFIELEKRSKVPLLSIVEVTTSKAHKLNMKKLLLLGIKFTMQSSFYAKFFAKHGIQVIIPSETEQDEINKIIFEELVIHVFKESSKRKLIGIISNYKVDGVILGCTELPLLIKQEDLDVTVFDTIEIHTEAVLDFALSN